MQLRLSRMLLTPLVRCANEPMLGGCAPASRRVGDSRNVWAELIETETTETTEAGSGSAGTRAIPVWV